METQDKGEIPLVGTRVKEETHSKIILEWWNRQSPDAFNPFWGLISFLRGVFSTSRMDSAEKDSGKESVTPERTTTIDFNAQRATCIEKLRSGKAEQTDLDLKEVSQVRIQMEEVGHHFRLYLDSPDHKPFQVSIAFFNSSYSPDDLVLHGKKIGRMLNKPVIRQHTDMDHLISEETLQA